MPNPPFRTHCYRPQANDTTPEVDRLEFALLGQKSNSDRALMTAALTRGARQLSLCGLSRTHNHLSDSSFARLVARAFLGEDEPPNFQPGGNVMTWIQDSLELAAQLHGVFETLAIPYYITGGVASTTYGEPRTTRDLDIVLSLPLSQLDLLVDSLEDVLGILKVQTTQLDFDYLQQWSEQLGLTGELLQALHEAGLRE